MTCRPRNCLCDVGLRLNAGRITKRRPKPTRGRLAESPRRCGLGGRRIDPMRRPFARTVTDEARKVVVMQDELTSALRTALYELHILPQNTEGALLGLYAVMDDVRAALRRAEAIDTSKAA